MHSRRKHHFRRCLPKVLKSSVSMSLSKSGCWCACVSTYLAEYPHDGLRTPGQTFRHYPVADTPFTVVFDYDAAEVRVLFIVHQRADRRRLNRADVSW